MRWIAVGCVFFFSLGVISAEQGTDEQTEGDVSADIMFESEFLGVPIADDGIVVDMVIGEQFSYYLVDNSQFGSREETMIYRMDKDTLLREQIFKGDAGKIFLWKGEVYVSKKSGRSSYSGIYRLEREAKRLVSIYEGKLYNGPWLCGGDFFLSTDNKKFLRVDAETGTRTVLLDTPAYLPKPWENGFIIWVQNGEMWELCRTDSVFTIRDVLLKKEYPEFFVLAESTLFVEPPDREGIMRVDVKTGKRKQISEDNPGDIFVYRAGKIYYHGGFEGWPIFVLDVETGMKRPINSERQNKILGQDEEYFYYFHDGTDSTWYLARYAYKEEHNRERLFSDRTIQAKKIIDGVLYFTLPEESDHLYAFDLERRSIECFEGKGSVIPLYRKGNLFYYYAGKRGERLLAVYDIEKNTEKGFAVVAGDAELHKGWFYFGNKQDGNTLYRLPVDGEEIEKVSDMNVQYLQSTGSALYGFFGVREDYTLFEIEEKGKMKVLDEHIKVNFPVSTEVNGWLCYGDWDKILLHKPGSRGAEVIFTLRNGFLADLTAADGRIFFTFDNGTVDKVCSILPDGSGYRIVIDKEVFGLQKHGGDLYYLYDVSDRYEDYRFGREEFGSTYYSFPYRIPQ